jgi:hypothetical protein
VLFNRLEYFGSQFKFGKTGNPNKKVGNPNKNKKCRKSKQKMSEIQIKKTETFKFCFMFEFRQKSHKIGYFLQFLKEISEK